MAAPSGIVWGDVYSSSSSVQGKLGIYIDLTNTNTVSTVNVQVWLWTKYGCEDSNNAFYFDVGANVTSAVTDKGKVTIKHTVSSGSGWSTKNQTKLVDQTFTYERGTAASTYKVYAKLSKVE